MTTLNFARRRSLGDDGGFGAGKQRRFGLAARHLMLTRPQLRRMRARFDVVAIDPAPQPGAPPVLTWIRGAFSAG